MLCELGVTEFDVLGADEPIHPRLAGADAVVVVENDVTPELLTVVAASRDADCPVAVLVDSLFTQNLPRLLGAGAHWTGTCDGPASLIQALEKLGVVPPGVSPYASGWGCADLRPQDPGAFSRILTDDPATLAALAQAELAAPTPQTVLITGETGTGKELVARAIHFGADGTTTPFVAVNCAALNAELFGTEIFGYVGGAFTGASSEGKAGKIELAGNGSL
ncbi:MAG: sigma 54-interacting transcriptional regulator, partial [Spirochaetota bacterium]